MQTILGAGGAIGRELAKSLREHTDQIRLVSRNPRKVNETDTLLAADLSVKEQVDHAVEGSDICYLTLGYDYDTKLWQEKWPPLIRNVIDACVAHGSKLVFFDNVYAIGGDNVKRITESSPISPVSKKGEVRADVDRQVLERVERGDLTAIIARAPDFISPFKDRSLLMHLIYDNLATGKKAQWFCNADVPHSTGFAPDLAKGTALLGNTPDAYNQIWNLPVDPEALTGREWVRLFARELNATDGVQVLPGFGMRALGLFVPILREMYEMRYQYDREYTFDSSKFRQAFGVTPTTNADAVRQTVAALKAAPG